MVLPICACVKPLPTPAPPRVPSTVLTFPEYSDADGDPVVLQQPPSEDDGWQLQVTPETGPDGWLYGTTFGWVLIGVHLGLHTECPASTGMCHTQDQGEGPRNALLISFAAASGAALATTVAHLHLRCMQPRTNMCCTLCACYT